MLYIFGDDVAVPLTRQTKPKPVLQHRHHHYNNPSGRRLAAQRGWNQLSDLGDSWNDLDQQYNRLEKDLGHVFQLFGIPVPENVTKRQKTEEGAAPVENSNNNKENETMETTPPPTPAGDNLYKLNIYMGEEYLPENIKISLKENVLMVEAKREQKSEDSRFYEEVSRKFTLPENVDLKEVKSVFAPNGILRIEAPLPVQPLPEPPKLVDIPIHIE
jgi:HSP20 family molecular chaperone IbpA